MDEYYEMYVELIKIIMGLCREYTNTIHGNISTNNNAFINHLCGSIFNGFNFHEQISLLHTQYLIEIKENCSQNEQIAIILAFRSLRVKVYKLKNFINYF